MASVSSCSYANLPGTSTKNHSNSKCVKRLQRTFEKHKAKPLPPVFKTRIDGPSPVWKVFKRLEMATTYADTCTKDCMIFSYESKVDNGGQRMFLVAHPKHFWSNYKIRPPEEKCSYEVIRENYPCKLYFDLEYYTCFNCSKDGDFMTKIFIKCVIAAVFQLHNLVISESDFLWLDASSKQKYSCHLILQMTGVAFLNNVQAGIFVSTLLSNLRTKIDNKAPSEGLWPSATEIKSLLIKTKNENQSLFCDEGVYTKNRNFRIYLSTKPGKNSPLRLSPHNLYIPFGNEKGMDRDEVIFYDSLITYFRDQKIMRFISYEGEVSSKIPHIAPTPVSSKRHGVSGCTSSPFPELDAFILKIIRDMFSVGFIRKWTYLSNEQRIIYDIGNYRFCHNIGRHHKSNNIKIHVDMKAKCYYQTCLDPECRLKNFQSEAIAVPEDITFISIPDDFFDSDCFTQQADKNPEVETDFTVSNGSEKLLNTEKNGCFDSFMDDESDRDFAAYFENFTQLNHVVDPLNITEKDDAGTSKSKIIKLQNSWDNFFDGDFSCTLAESVDKKRACEMSDSTEQSTCILNSEFWCTESVFDDTDSSKMQLGNITHDEELLMAEAAEATEAAMNENMFSEETVF